MTSRTLKSKRFWLLAALMLIGGFALSFLAAHHTASIRQQKEKPVTSQDTLPKIISKVKYLEIVGATIRREEPSGGWVDIEVKNNSDSAVYFFALTNGTIKTNEYGVSRDGLNVDGDPQVVITPHGTATLSMALISLDGRYPIVLSAAGFTDGSEEGEPSVLEYMRTLRARDKAKRDAEKEKAKQEAEKGARP